MNTLGKIHKEALRYVRNSGGHATKDHFIEDYEPIGELLWDELVFADTVGINNSGKIFLSPKGDALLTGNSS